MDQSLPDQEAQEASRITIAILQETFPHSATPGKLLYELFYPVVVKVLREITA